MSETSGGSSTRSAAGAPKDVDSGAGSSAESSASKSAARAGVRLSTTALRERKVERRGALSLTSRDVDATRDKLVAAATQAGGYVADEHGRAAEDGTLSSASLQLVVPTDAFDDAMTGFGAAGTVVSQTRTARDVTERVVDVASRVASADASLRRIRLLLGRAEKLGDIVSLESELGARQADLEALQAQRQSLAARTDTATIGVSVRRTADASAADDTRGFLAGLSAGWSALGSVWNGLGTAAGAILPFTVALGVPALLVAGYVRRHRRRRVPPAPATT